MSISYLPQVRSDEPKLVLSLEGCVKEAVHELEGLLLVFKEPATIDTIHIQVEVSLFLAALEHFLELSGFLGEQTTEVNRLHGVDGDGLAVPLDSLRDLCRGSHVDSSSTA